MQTFWEWIKENYFTFDSRQYDNLFDEELEKLIARIRDPAHRQVLERLRNFGWTGYIAAAVRNAGYRDQREVQERTHDVVVKLLTGTLFKGFDELRSGPMDLRFKRSVSNAVRNMVELEKNRRRYIPVVPLDDLPARSQPAQDENIIHDFRRLVHKRLGGLGVAVLDVRLAGGETKSLVGLASLGSPGKWMVKRTVHGIKQLAREFFQGDPDLLRQVERAMAAEGETVAKRRLAMAARMRQGVGA